VGDTKRAFQRESDPTGKKNDGITQEDIDRGMDLARKRREALPKLPPKKPTGNPLRMMSWPADNRPKGAENDEPHYENLNTDQGVLIRKVAGKVWATRYHTGIGDAVFEADPDQAPGAGLQSRNGIESFRDLEAELWILMRKLRIKGTSFGYQAKSLQNAINKAFRSGRNRKEKLAQPWRKAREREEYVMGDIRTASDTFRGTDPDTGKDIALTADSFWLAEQKADWRGVYTVTEEAVNSGIGKMNGKAKGVTPFNGANATDLEDTPMRIFHVDPEILRDFPSFAVLGSSYKDEGEQGYRQHPRRRGAVRSDLVPTSRTVGPVSAGLRSLHLARTARRAAHTARRMTPMARLAAKLVNRANRIQEYEEVKSTE
jgi:hypothetical protein